VRRIQLQLVQLNCGYTKVIRFLSNGPVVIVTA
jgi:hypothetical protein